MIDRLPMLLAAHARLALLALLAAALLAFPFGILAHRRPRLGRLVVGFASVVQTIPGLALLAVMVPLLALLELPSIGVLPAFLGLTLYGLLPILQNTVTGLAGVDRGVLRAADGVGMTPSQRLWRVELPLALPVMMAGLRTATVWTVGMATLSTPVGAPSLGNLIFGGLQTRQYGAVLLGCIASAALALFLDGCLRLAEGGARGPRWRLGVGMFGVALVALASILPLLDSDAAQVRIGAKTFTEQYVLAALLESEMEVAGAQAEVVSSLGSTVVFDALAGGEIDMYVEYTGTVLATSMHEEVGERAEVFARVRDWLRARDIEVACRLGFENTYALMTRGDSMTRIEDLGARAPRMSIGGDYEFFERDEWRDLQRVYGLRFEEERAMDPALMYDAVARGTVDVIAGYSTDGRIDAFDLTVLDDARGVVPPYDAVVLVRPGFREDHPRLFDALAALEGAITPEAMRQMNRSVDQDGLSPPDAARSWAR